LQKILWPVVKGSKQRQNDLQVQRNFCIETLMQDGKPQAGTSHFRSELCKSLRREIC
jgi:hypothetical protein